MNSETNDFGVTTTTPIPLYTMSTNDRIIAVDAFLNKLNPNHSVNAHIRTIEIYLSMCHSMDSFSIFRSAIKSIVTMDDLKTAMIPIIHEL
jgi:hypothetical protein